MIFIWAAAPALTIITTACWTRWASIIRLLSATEIAGIYNESASGFGFAPTNWLVLDFGSSYSTNPNSAANVDTNSDGLLNWQKYFYGDNPAGHESVLHLGRPAGHHFRRSVNHRANPKT